MRNSTRIAFNQYLTQIATLSSVSDATKTFSVAPSVQQTLETLIQESSAFLGKINILGVKDQEGQKVGLGVSGPIASRTDTTGADRAPRDVSSLNSNNYRCEQTNFDTYIRYALMDAWAKFPDFQTRLRNAIVLRQALDRMTIGFNGTSVAANTDIVANPLLQDVNKGWLQQYRDNADERVLDSGNTEDVIKIGSAANADYANLDAAVFDAVNLLDPWYQDDPGLVVMMGRALLNDKYFPLVNATQAPTETLASDIIVSQKRVGGLQAVSVPFFPVNALMITRYDNLSIYWQEETRRRRVEDNPKRDRIENYESSNDAYVVEDYGCGAIIENITFEDAA